MPTPRSPLEHSPEMIQGLGLITARWGLLDLALSELLGQFTVHPEIGKSLYFAMSSFSVRIDAVEEALKTGLTQENHRAITLKVTKVIKQKWKKRNHLVHSGYVYRVTDNLGHTDLVVAGKVPRENIEEMGSPSLIVDGIRYEPIIKNRSFGYIERKAGSNKEFVPVNKGTFANHAEAISKRIRQISSLKRAITRGRVPLWIP